MNAHRLARHLAATRITDLAAPAAGPLPEIYHQWHSDLTGRLRRRFAPLENTELYVACTANAASALFVSPDGGKTVVHDQHLGRTLNRMTQFVIGDWRASRVHGWAFERLAVSALSAGDLEATRLALALSETLRGQDAIPSVDPSRDAARQLMVSVGEFFVLAHEVAHTALGPDEHARLQRDLRDDFALALQRPARDSVRSREIAERMVTDLVQAVSRRFGHDVAPDAEELEALTQWAQSDDRPVDYAAWLDSHTYMYVELTCDLIATDLTLEHFAEVDAAIDARAALPGVLMALHHLASLEYLDLLGRSGQADASETVTAAVVRKSVWREITREIYAEVGTDRLWQLYAEVSQDHAAKLGDQVLFVVPVLWGQARDLLREGRDPEASETPVEAKKLRDLVWSLADPDPGAQRRGKDDAKLGE